MKNQINHQKLTILVLAVLLILTLSYIGIENYQKKKQKEQLTLFQQGAQYGYEQAVIQIIDKASTCQQVPLFVQNQTINMIAVECLKTN